MPRQPPATAISRSSSTRVGEQSPRAAPAARPAARPQVLAVLLEQVVRDQHHRHVGEDLRAELEPADPPLQLREGQGTPSFHGMISPSITVPSGSASPAAASSGKRSVTSSSPRDQIQRLPLAPDQLRPDAVPLPLRLPLRRIAQRRELALERIRQVERIGPRPVGIARVRRHQRREPLRRRRPLPAQPMGQRLLVHAAELSPARARPAAATRRRGTRR